MDLPWRAGRVWACLLITLITLLPSSSSAASEDAFRASNDSLLWGPYKPNLYFGVRPRIPKSLSVSLMWSRVEDVTVQRTFRHTCEQNQGMAGYGWEEYDARMGGKQVIYDEENRVDIVTQFAKVPGGSDGGNWGARISGILRAGAPRDTVSTVIFHVGLEGAGTLQVKNEHDPLGYEGSVSMLGQTPELGGFNIEITSGYKNKHPPSFEDVEQPLDRTMVKSFEIPEDVIWQTKPLLFRELKGTIDRVVGRYGHENLQVPPYQIYTIGTNEPLEGNAHLIQKVFKGPFEFDILFSSSSSPEPMTSAKLTTALRDNSAQFAKRFKEKFPAQDPFDQSNYDDFGKSMFSNLAGGIGSFHGDQVIDRSYAPEYEEDNEGFWEESASARAKNNQGPEGPYDLYTSVPSRPFFPRGFLWDEGFHLLPIVDYDIGVALEILRSWYNTMDEDGWIPREQILGNEARIKVPDEFQVQYPHYANPPTLNLAVEAILDRLTSDTLSSAEKKSHTEILKQLYPLLKRNYAWYRRTQRGDLKTYDREAFSSKEAYRWRGRTPSHILTSGLDDYPRAQPPHPGELHLDLLSWMGLMARSMKRVAQHLAEDEDGAEYTAHEAAITRNVDDLHWDDEGKAYCDATIDDYEESAHACHKGYVSIFPLLTGILQPDSPHLGAVLDLIRDPEELWSAHGIRSLSKKDPLYGTDENYWRSPVWININYLALDNLLRIAQAKGPLRGKARAMYVDLRKNLVETVYKSWKETGFAWEQYNPDSGDGQRTQHFTGWTSLVVKMMCMPDLSSRRDEL